MNCISNLTGRFIFDSRGIPTVEAEVTLNNGLSAIASVPSGASTGSKEAVELRDKDTNLYNGKSVFKAVDNINTKIFESLVGLTISPFFKMPPTITPSGKSIFPMRDPAIGDVDITWASIISASASPIEYTFLTFPCLI